MAPPLLSDLVAQTGQVPLSHVRPVGDRPDLASVDNESGVGIPLIDLRKLDGPERRTVAEAIGRACESEGFFMVGLCVAISAAFLLSFLSESSLGATGGAQAARAGEPAAVAIPLAVAAFFTAVTFLYAHIRRGGRRIPEVALFVLCGSIGLLDLSLSAQPGPLQAPQLGAAAARVLPPPAVATFFLAVTLIYARGRTAVGADANQQKPAAVEVLEKLTLAAALFTGVLGSLAAALILDTK